MLPPVDTLTTLVLPSLVLLEQAPLAPATPLLLLEPAPPAPVITPLLLPQYSSGGKTTDAPRDKRDGGAAPLADTERWCWLLPEGKTNDGDDGARALHGNAGADDCGADSILVSVRDWGFPAGSQAGGGGCGWNG
jgi:hypothetical protein